jgi:hypothetical protein
MIYKYVYFYEEKQKVKFIANASIDIPIQYEYVGKMNDVEFNVLIDFLWEIYQDNDIPLDEFKKHFRDFRHFLDAKKQLFKTK